MRTAVPGARAAAAGDCRIVVCRGCCCGGLDGVGDPADSGPSRLARLREALAGSAVRVQVSRSCLGPCARGDVVVVGPSPAARARGARPRWFGRAESPAAVADLARWVVAGGPGRAILPVGLGPHEIEPEPALGRARTP